MFHQKLSVSLKLIIITLIAGVSSLCITKLDYLLGIQQPKSENNQANQDKLMAVSLTTNQINQVPNKFRGTVVYQGKLKANEKVIALTFDDGPSPKNTAQVLAILQKHHVKATFFMIGEMVKYFPQVAKQVAADGDVIGNHTWHHSYRHVDVVTAANEINTTADIIYQTTGVKTTLFRPPGGFLNNGLAHYAKSQNYTVIMWSEVSGDAERPSPQVSKMVNNVLKNAKPGVIVLMHDGGGNRSRTVQALPQIIDGLKAQGYRFVTIPELLEIQAKEKI
ncbi:MAG: polysaccharide deacetylase family protein [Nostoc sp. CreGUA01]|nr:polysaccharide deacetylase family protein [Nostoc sp. CreGUA01]